MKSIPPEMLLANYRAALKAETCAYELKEGARRTLERREEELRAANKLTAALGALLEALALTGEKAHIEEEARIWAQLHNTDVPPLNEAPPEPDSPATIAVFDAEVEE